MFLVYPLVKVISSPGLLIKGKMSDEEKEESVELVDQKNKEELNEDAVEVKVAE